MSFIYRFHCSFLQYDLFTIIICHDSLYIPVVVLNYAGFTTLHLAIVKSRNEVAKLLISELGAKGMGAVSETGITAAHVAASSGKHVL